MRRRIALLSAVMMAMGVVSAVPATANSHEGGTYLALGDSVAAGTQQPVPFTDGYTSILYQKLMARHGLDDFVNLACPGDDTTEMISGIGGASEFGSLCYGPFAQLPPGGTSQLDAAVAYLAANPGEVKLITLTMGANDLLACELTDPPDELNACLGAQLGLIGANLPVILGTLQAAAPGVPIVAMNYYNPNLAFWVTGAEGRALAAASLDLTALFNGTLEAVYGAFGVPVADVEKAFRTFNTRGPGVPKNVKQICRLTLMCERQAGGLVLSDYDPVEPGPQSDIHPSNHGYRVIAKTFHRLIHSTGALTG